MSIITVLLSLVVVYIYFYMNNQGKIRCKQKWNNGISPYTGEKWQPFDTDSSGADGYRDSQGNVIWIGCGQTLDD
jgi:hypothetical protein